jgi:purine-nucleoside phosphorylase
MHEGIYLAVSGPSYETPAEIRAFRMLGADVVGMSTVPEVIVANHEGMRVLGLSIITDQCLPDALEPASIDRIIETARGSEPSLRRLVARVVEQS